MRAHSARGPRQPPVMNGVHPALAFLQDKMPTARAVGADTLRLEIDGAWVEIFLAPAHHGPAFFAAGHTKLAYRCSSGLSDLTKERLHRVLLELKAPLAAGRVIDPRAPLPEGGDGPTASTRATRGLAGLGGAELPRRGRSGPSRRLPWAAGLPRPAHAAAHSIAVDQVDGTTQTGPCARCGRARVCPSARDSAEDEEGLRTAAPWRCRQRRARRPAGAVEGGRAPVGGCPRGLHAAYRRVRGPSPRLAPRTRVLSPASGGEGNRVGFASSATIRWSTSDAARREINRGRRAAVRRLAARWLTPRETSLP